MKLGSQVIVTLRNGTMEGYVLDIRGNNIYVRVNNTMYKFDISQVQEVQDTKPEPQTLKGLITSIMEMVQEMGITNVPSYYAMFYGGSHKVVTMMKIGKKQAVRQYQEVKALYESKN